MNTKRVVRSILAIIIGIVFISGVVELLEFSLVTAVNGQPTTDPNVYYGIRNRGWFLIIKLLYNTLAAIAGGFIAAWIAGYAPLKHGFALAIIQTLAFGAGLLQPAIRNSAPAWLWVALVLLTFAGVLLGARFRSIRLTKGL
jgi:hypothetical protein